MIVVRDAGGPSKANRTDAMNQDRRREPDRRKEPTRVWGAFPRPAGGCGLGAPRSIVARYFVDRFSATLFVQISPC